MRNDEVVRLSVVGKCINDNAMVIYCNKTPQHTAAIDLSPPLEGGGTLPTSGDFLFSSFSRKKRVELSQLPTNQLANQSSV